MKFAVAMLSVLSLVAPSAAGTIYFTESCPHLAPFLLCEGPCTFPSENSYLFQSPSGGYAAWTCDGYLHLKAFGSEPDTVRMERWDGQTFDLSNLYLVLNESPDALGTFEVVTSKGASQSIDSLGPNLFTGPGFEAIAYVDFVLVPAGIFADDYLVDYIDVALNATTTGVGPSDPPPPGEILQNIPNPFNPSTAIRFRLDKRTQATLRIYDVNGRVVRTLFEAGPLDPGEHDFVWDGRDTDGREVASGVYFSRLVTDDFTGVQKLTLVR